MLVADSQSRGGFGSDDSAARHVIDRAGISRGLIVLTGKLIAFERGELLGNLHTRDALVTLRIESVRGAIRHNRPLRASRAAGRGRLSSAHPVPQTHPV